MLSRPPPLALTYVARIIVKNEGNRATKRPQSHVRLLTYFCVSLVSHSVDGASSKKLQFSTLTAQDVVKISEFQVTHRDLYTTTDRAPVKDGVLDRRLVRSYMSFHPFTARCEFTSAPGYVGEERVL